MDNIKKLYNYVNQVENSPLDDIMEKNIIFAATKGMEVVLFNEMELFEEYKSLGYSIKRVKDNKVYSTTGSGSIKHSVPGEDIYEFLYVYVITRMLTIKSFVYEY